MIQLVTITGVVDLSAKLANRRGRAAIAASSAYAPLTDEWAREPRVKTLVLESFARQDGRVVALVLEAFVFGITVGAMGLFVVEKLIGG